MARVNRRRIPSIILHQCDCFERRWSCGDPGVRPSTRLCAGDDYPLAALDRFCAGLR